MIFKLLKKEVYNTEPGQPRRSVFHDELQSSRSANKYRGLYGFYWRFEDQIVQMVRNKQEYLVVKKPDNFRHNHDEIKAKIQTNRDVTRDKLFPYYDNRRKYYQKRKEHKRELLKKKNESRQLINQLNKDMRDLDAKLPNSKHVEIYNKLLDVFLGSDIVGVDQFYDGLYQLQNS